MTVKLTGIISILSKTKALVEITEGPGKPAKKPILAEGEGSDNVEVVTIDVKKNTVTFKIGEVVTNMTFEVAKSPAGPTPGAPVPGVPGVPPVPGRPALPSPPPMAASPTVIGGESGAGRSGRSSVVVVGNNAAPASAVPAGASAAGMSMAFGAGAPGGMAPSANVTVSDGSGGLRTIPSRVPRATTPQPQGTVDPAMQYLNLRLSEEAAKQRGIPHPPTPPIPGLQ